MECVSGVSVGASVSGVSVGGGASVGASDGGVCGQGGAMGWEKQCLLLQEQVRNLREIVQEVKSENVALRSVLEENGLIGSQEKWKVVSGAGKLRMKVCKDPLTVPCRNSFSVLQEEGDVQVLKDRKGKADEISQPKGKCKIKLIGDSLCRYLGERMKTKVSSNDCFPGAGVAFVADRIGGLVERDSVSCLVVRGNDIHKRRSEEMVKWYREALQAVRRKGGRAAACGILPRMGHGREWLSRAIGFNRRLESYCRENGFVFVDVWDYFYGKGQMYARDGVHLSRAGTSVLAGLLDRAVMGFC